MTYHMRVLLCHQSVTRAKLPFAAESVNLVRRCSVPTTWNTWRAKLVVSTAGKRVFKGRTSPTLGAEGTVGAVCGSSGGLRRRLTCE